MNEQRDIGYLKDIIRRRSKAALLSFLLFAVSGASIAYFLPPTYKAESTILIEEQRIPSTYIHRSITAFVEERLQTITQRIMSYSELIAIINQFDLYSHMRQRYTTSEIVEKMRKDINLRTISADVRDRLSGRPAAATIAFTLSFEGKDPSKVQKVANVLASLYLEENLKSREERASDTTAFFKQELDALQGQIDVLQGKISAFKSAHVGELPEYNSLNMQTLVRLNRDLDLTDAKISSLRERKILLEGQLATLDPLRPLVTEDGKTVMNPSDRLKFLRLQLQTS